MGEDVFSTASARLCHRCHRPRPAPRPGRRRRRGRLRVRRQSGPGRSPRCRDVRAVSRRGFRRPGRVAGQRVGGWRGRPAPCRTRGRAVTRSRPPLTILGGASCGSGNARTSRSSLSRPTVAPSRAAIRAPARPASATPIAATSCATAACGVRIVWSDHRPASMKVLAGQSELMQKKRRTRSRMFTRRPANGASASVRT